MLKEKGRTEIYHFMSHFACTSQSVEKVKKNKAQYEEFTELSKPYVRKEKV